MEYSYNEFIFFSLVIISNTLQVTGGDTALYLVILE